MHKVTWYRDTIRRESVNRIQTCMQDTHREIPYMYADVAFRKFEEGRGENYSSSNQVTQVKSQFDFD